ncbi:MAG: hypothetical protein RQ985_06815 [Dehalococcoidia bacterium]|nr:hypothetical protein [Dehalococcoidia bacterium]
MGFIWAKATLRTAIIAPLRKPRLASALVAVNLARVWLLVRDVGAWENGKTGVAAMDDFGLDMDEALRAIDAAEVLVVRFAVLDKRLLVDFRTSQLEGPFIALVPKAGSLEERYKSLKRLRPRFPLPDKIVALMWHRTSVDTFRLSGLWDHIVARLVSIGGEEMREKAEEVYRQLLLEERKEILAAIRGDSSYHSLWERPRHQ